MRLTAKSMFLVDGLGALVSAVFLGLMLPKLESWVGMPVQALHPLALIALLFAVYSLSCWRFANHSKAIWLRLILTANMAYCLLTLALVSVFYSQLSALGLAYFVAEALIIVGLVCTEVRVLRTLKP